MPKEHTEKQVITPWVEPEITRSPNKKVISVIKFTSGILRKYTFCLDRHIVRYHEDLPEDVTAVLVEGGGKDEPWTNSIKVDNDTGQQFADKDFLNYYRFFSPEYAGEDQDGIYRRFERDKIPVMVADPALNDVGKFYSKFVAAAETSLTVSTLINLYRRKDFTISRRNLFKLGITAWSAMPAVEAFMYYKLGNQAEFIPPEWRDEFIKYPHPELWFFILTLRDTILPHKKEWMAQYTMGRESTHIATIMGAAHSGAIDQMRRSPQQRMAFLKEVNFLLPEAFHVETIYKSTIFKYNKENELQDGQVFEIPELRALVLPQLKRDQKEHLA